jgi:membrane protein implicated in regulation of membrane protease activity
MYYDILYWHWIVLGLALALSEIMLTSFFILWFGAAAVVVGCLLYIFPELSLTWQVLIWTTLSSALAWGWFKYLKPLSIDRTKAGLSAEAIIGETGQVLSPPNGEKKGTLRFPAPILGDDEWLFISEDALSIGDRIVVQNISGNSLIVKKHV